MKKLAILICVVILGGWFNFALAVQKPASPLGRELVAAERQVDNLLRVGKASRSGVIPINTAGSFRLSKKNTLELRDQQFTIGTGLGQSIEIMQEAKNKLDRAIKSGAKIDGHIAATFLARYAWFMAAYACRNGGYPEARFKNHISQALKLDPKNVQALFLKACLIYERHCRLIANHVPGSHIWTGQLVLSDKHRKQAARLLRKSVRLDPGFFPSWEILGLIESTTNQNGKILVIPGGVLLGELRSSKHVDMFYYSYNLQQIQLATMATRALIRQFPTYYEKYFGHLPSATKPAK